MSSPPPPAPSSPCFDRCGAVRCTPRRRRVQEEAAFRRQQLQHQLTHFWNQQWKEMEDATDFRNHHLPLARIKKIMKSDEEVRVRDTCLQTTLACCVCNWIERERAEVAVLVRR